MLRMLEKLQLFIFRSLNSQSHPAFHLMLLCSESNISLPTLSHITFLKNNNTVLLICGLWFPHCCPLGWSLSYMLDQSLYSSHYSLSCSCPLNSQNLGWHPRKCEMLIPQSKATGISKSGFVKPMKKCGQLQRKQKMETSIWVWL